MNKKDFEIHFEKLATNPWEFPPKATMEQLADLCYDKFRNLPIKAWEQMVEKCLETESKFPPISKFFALSKQILSKKDNKSYQHCPLCNYGYVSMLLVFDFETKKCIERHFWSIERRKHLQDTKGILVSRYVFFCGCEWGNDLHTLKGGNGGQITLEEYEELKIEAAKPGGIGAAFHLREHHHVK